MRIILLAASTALLASCDTSVSTFGKSYDECILKNAREGGDRSSRDTATAICERRFTKDATSSDRAAFGIATNVIDNPGTADYVQIGVTAREPNVILKEVRSVITFYRTAKGRDSRDSSDIMDIYTWDRLPVLWDDWTGIYTASGSATGGALSPFWTAETVPTKVIKLQ